MIDKAQTVISHDSYVNIPETKLNRTANEQIVMDIADVMGIPPQNIDDTYFVLCKRVAALLGVKAISNNLESVSNLQPQKKLQVGVEISTANTSVDMDSSISITNAALSFRNGVYKFINDVSVFIADATNAGLVPPSNPFVVIAELDAKRRNKMGMIVQNAGTEFMPQGNAAYPIEIDATTADNLVFNIGAFTQLLAAQRNGQLNISDVARKSAQINSFSFSLDGYGSTGDVAVDILRFIPSADYIRAQKNNELLSAFDFKKRIARIIFVCDYIVEGKKLGAIIGWKKIADASGYVITKSSIFDVTRQEIYLTNDILKQFSDTLSDYVEHFVTSFYDMIDKKNILFYLDQSISQDSYYQYSIRAFQRQNKTSGKIFTVDNTVNSLTPITRNKISVTLKELTKKYFGSENIDDINPWPVISEQIFGDSRFDWILSAVNTRASLNRYDQFEDTRKFSYLGAHIADIWNLMDRNLFVIPNDISTVMTNIENSISNFGLFQTITELLQDTGILYYVEGTENVQPDGFSRAGIASIESSKLLKSVFSAIDSDNAILDLRALGSNIPFILNSMHASDSVNEKMNVSSVNSTSKEITVPDIGLTSDVVAQGDIQYIGSTPSIDDSHVDLMTFDGVSKLIRTIRIFSDVGSARGGGTTVADGITPPTQLAPPSIESVSQNIQILNSPELQQAINPAIQEAAPVVEAQVPTESVSPAQPRKLAITKLLK